MQHTTSRLEIIIIEREQKPEAFYHLAGVNANFKPRYALNTWGLCSSRKIKAVLIILEQIMCSDQYQVSLSKFSTVHIHVHYVQLYHSTQVYTVLEF